jgi:DNA-binding NtrC family response regulator/tetratricopeptide (TPR) repeat protein
VKREASGRSSDLPDLGPRYRFIRDVGRGGMGSIYLVHDDYLKKDLALKLVRGLRPGGEEVEEIQREFALLARLEHPGLARAHDFGWLGGRPFFTREFVPGETPGAGGGPEDIDLVLRIARQVADALGFLHRNEVLHLDVKPGNIIVMRDGAPRAVLIDFGLCRRGLAAPPGPHLKGSLPYMAPEYFGGGDLGPWTDVYALGVSIYRLATGRFPRQGALAGSGRAAPASAWAAPPPPSQLRPDLPADFDNVVLKCLAIDPAARFPSGIEVARALESLGGIPAPAERRASSIATFGRGPEIDRADAFLDGILGRRPAPPALLVVGAPGMGSSHFLREVKMRAQTRSIAAYLESGFPGRTNPPGSVLRCLSAHMTADREARSRWESFLARLREPRRPLLVDVSEGERRLRRASEVALAAGTVRDPLLIAIDDLQHCDEVSIALAIDLIRFLAGRTGSGRPPIGVAASVREEGASIPLLRELVALLLEEGKGEIIALGPLGMRESAALHSSQLGTEAGKKPSALEVFARTGGCPRAIVDLAAGRATAGSDGGGPGRVGGRGAPRAEERAVLLAMALLERPAGEAELSRICGLSGARIRRVLRGLAAKVLAAETDGPGGKEWVPGPAAAPRPAASERERRRIHRRIARTLVGSEAGDPRTVEAVRHFRLAGDRAAVVRHGLPAARWLESTFQSRAALELLGSVLAAIPQHRRLVRVEIALEVADLQTQVGDFDAGLLSLQEFLPSLRALARPARLRTLLRIAVLHARRGDFPRADALFAEELAEARGAGSMLAREEMLFFLNEHAMVKAFRGDYAEAAAICEEGLDLVRGGASFRIREMEMNILATRANIALRTFDFPGAVRDFGRSLEVAEAIGSAVNQAVILSNLGIVHAQCDRYPEAIRALCEAERLCLRLDEGPSLVSIHGNLAILHSKCGDFEAMERELRECERLGPAGIGRRQELFLEHARGLCLVNRGRHAEARPRLEAALRIAAEMGDRHLAAFDEVYRAECLIFEARYGEAAGELRRSAEPGRPGRMRMMALARLALLGALTGQEGVRREAVAARTGIEDRPVPFLDAWDRLFLGWAASIAGDVEEAAALLDPAAAFFRACGLAPALSLALWARAEALYLAGDTAAARDALAGVRPANDLVRVIHPLLAARLLLAGGRRGDVPRAGDLLAEAGGALLGSALPEWAARLTSLRALCQDDPSPGRAEAERLRREAARELPEGARRRYLRLPHWKAWTSGKTSTSREGDRPAAPRLEAEGSRTATMEAAASSSRRPGLVTRSRAMRRLAGTLDRLRGSELPVLIEGETGTGKELVARTIHRESRRAGGPFVVIDCAAIPGALLEAELFGARAGAFTDLRKDRRGILSLAAGGTALVDGIGEAGPDVQAKLLRAVSEMSVRPLGSEREETLDVRFLFATSRDLEAEAREGRFRRDLFHRIRGVAVEVPPLRHRAEDIPDLVAMFLAEGGAEPIEIGPGVLERLGRLPWPGNVRELKNLLARLRLECPRRIDVDAVDRLSAESDTTAAVFPRRLLDREDLPGLHERLERDFLVHHFRRLGGSTEGLCRFLGLGPRQLYRRCERLGISLREEKARLESR